MFLSIVIAVYNEKDNIKELTDRIYKSLGSLKIPFELIYVIDGTDGSFEITKNIKESKDNLIINHSPKPRGLKNAFVKGFSLVDKNATHILTMDADLNHQPEEIKDFISAVETTGGDIIIGSRYIKNARIEKLKLPKRAISKFSNFVIKLLWNMKIKDKTSGYRLYKRRIIDKVIPLLKSKNFEFLFEILILSSHFGYKIIEIPIIFKAREKGESKFELFKTMSGYLKLVFWYFLRKNPY